MRVLLLLDEFLKHCLFNHFIMNSLVMLLILDMREVIVYQKTAIGF